MFETIFRGRRRNNLLTPEAYQAHVVAFLRSKFPEESVEPTPEPFIIRCGDAELGLQSLYNKYTGEQLGARERDDCIREHFSRMFRNLRAKEEFHLLPWAQVRPLLRVQLMPPEYSDRVALLTYPFMDDVAIALVIDLAETYSYVRPDDGQRWGVSPEELYQCALENLNHASGGIEMTVSEAPERFVGIEAKDGYDAARLLVPGIRQKVLEHLDEPCLAIIPNRDFLFFWSRTNSAQFHAFAREKCLRDFQQQPYPLTSTVFSVSADRVEPEVQA